MGDTRGLRSNARGGLRTTHTAATGAIACDTIHSTAPFRCPYYSQPADLGCAASLPLQPHPVRHYTRSGMARRPLYAAAACVRILCIRVLLGLSFLATPSPWPDATAQPLMIRAQPPDCGALGDAVCPDGSCLDGLVAVAVGGVDVCTSCGGLGQPPCTSMLLVPPLERDQLENQQSPYNVQTYMLSCRAVGYSNLCKCRAQASDSGSMRRRQRQTWRTAAPELHSCTRAAQLQVHRSLPFSRPGATQ